MDYGSIMADFGQLARRFEERVVDIIPTVAGAVAIMAAGLMLAQFTKYLRGVPADPDIQFNLLTNELDVSAS